MPTITHPVMRYLGTKDASRSVAFFRDVLGFEAGETDGGWEMTRGAARIRFGDRDYGALDWEAPREPGCAMVFFGTDDVDAMRAEIVGRGGGVSRSSG